MIFVKKVKGVFQKYNFFHKKILLCVKNMFIFLKHWIWSSFLDITVTKIQHVFQQPSDFFQKYGTRDFFRNPTVLQKNLDFFKKKSKTMCQTSDIFFLKCVKLKLWPLWAKNSFVLIFSFWKKITFFCSGAFLGKNQKNHKNPI